jgi:hypothetical protein
MVDRDKIESLIRHLRQYTAYLQEIVELDQGEFLRDPRSIGSARYYLQIAIETCINIANHIIASERLRAPKDYKGCHEHSHSVVTGVWTTKRAKQRERRGKLYPLSCLSCYFVAFVVQTLPPE